MEHDVIKQLKEENEKLKKELTRRTEEQEKFKIIFKDAKDTIFIADGETGMIVDANKSAEKLLGRPRKEIIGIHQSQLHPQEELNQTKESFVDDLKRGSQTIYKNFHVVHKDGRYIPVEISPSIIKINNKKHVYGIFRDVSERKKAEEEFRNLFENQGEGIGYLDKEEVFLFANPAAEEIFGVEKGKLVNRHIKDFLSNKAYNKVLEQTQLRKEGKKTSYELEIKQISGKTVPIIVTATPRYDEKGNFIGSFGIFRDISQLKDTEQKLKKNEAILKRTEKLAHVGSWDWDVDTDTVRWSDKLFRIFKTDPNEGGVSYASHHQIYTPGSLKKLQKAVDEALKNGTPYNLDLDFVRSNGEIGHGHVTGFAGKNKNGKVVKLFGSFQDITRRKKAEESLKIREEQFRAIFETAEDSIFIKNKNLEYVKVNPAMEKLFDKKAKDIINKTDEELFGGKAGKSILEIDKQVLEGKIIEEYPSKPVDGKIHTFHTIKVPLKDADGNITGLCGIARDITTQKRAEQAIKESEQKYKQLIETASDAIYLMNEEGKFVDINDSACKMLNRSKQELLSLGIDDIDPNFTRKQFKEFWKKIPFNEQRIFETQHKKKDNTLIAVEISGKKYKIGNQTFYYGIARDITDRKKAEKKLKDSEEKYKTVLNNVMEGIFVLQGDYVVYANPAVQKITGYTMENIRNMKFSVAVYEEDRKKVLENYKRRLAGENIQAYDFRIKTKDGSTRWFLLNATKIQWKGKDADLVFVQDIHDRKLAEDALKENEKKYREIVELSPDGIATLNLSGKILSVNQAFSDITGYSKDAFLGKNYLKAPTLIKQEFSTYKKMFLSIVNGKNDETTDFKWKHKNGEIRDGQAKVKLIKKGVLPVKIQVIVRDVTERRKEQELRNEVIVAQNSARLKQKFLANISHEMRTPMNGIIGMTEFLADTNLTDQQQNYVETIKESSESLLNIINDVLNLTKIEQGLAEYIFENINIIELIDNTINIFKAQAFRKKINLQCHIEQNFPRNILLDKQNFRQILYNLISNAVKYTNKGEVKLELQLLKKKGKTITGKIIISDTGIGIKQQDREKIFDPFVRVDDSFTRTTEGTGLGLSITKKLVKIFGGDLDFESEVNKGSKFWFTFQSEIMPEEEVVEKKTAIQCDETLHLHILLAEDKELNYKVASMMLKNLGCTLDIAKNGKEVLELYPKSKYDIILMDIMMPEMDGIEAMKQLKKKYKNLPPIIGLSAHAMEGDAERFIEMGMDDYLEKPVNKNKLAEKLRKWGE